MTDGGKNHPYDGNGWSQWSKFVLKELERLHSEKVELQKALFRIEKELSLLKYKHTLWAMVGSAIPVLAYAFYEFVIKK